jgi:hypothetical protein
VCVDRVGCDATSFYLVLQGDVALESREPPHMQRGAQSFEEHHHASECSLVAPVCAPMKTSCVLCAGGV